MPAVSSIVFCISNRRDVGGLFSTSVLRRRQIVPEPPLLIFCLCHHDVARRRSGVPAYSAAARPARAPNTSSSGRELDPSRFAPLMLTQATSPAAYKPCQRRCAVDIGVHPAHHVVHDRPDGNELSSPDRGFRTSGTTLAQTEACSSMKFGAEVAQVEVDDRSVGTVDRATLLELLHEGLGEAIARPQSMLRKTGLGCGFQLVVLQIAVAVLVQQVSAFRAGRFGDQDAGERESRGVILDELHVLERRAGP